MAVANGDLAAEDLADDPAAALELVALAAASAGSVAALAGLPSALWASSDGRYMATSRRR